MRAFKAVTGGFKTNSIGIPTLLTWTGSAVVLGPSREIGPMVTAFRRQRLGHSSAFFKGSGRDLMTCLLADLLWDPALSPQQEDATRTPAPISRP